MFFQSYELRMPRVMGIELTGRLSHWCTAKGTRTHVHTSLSQFLYFILAFLTKYFTLDCFISVIMYSLVRRDLVFGWSTWCGWWHWFCFGIFWCWMRYHVSDWNGNYLQYGSWTRYFLFILLCSWMLGVSDVLYVSYFSIYAYMKTKGVGVPTIHITASIYLSYLMLFI